MLGWFLSKNNDGVQKHPVVSNFWHDTVCELVNDFYIVYLDDILVFSTISWHEKR